MIPYMLSSKTFNTVATKLFIRGRKLNIFIGLLENHTLQFQNMLGKNSTLFNIKIQNRREL